MRSTPGYYEDRAFWAVHDNFGSVFPATWNIKVGAVALFVPWVGVCLGALSAEGVLMWARVVSAVLAGIGGWLGIRLARSRVVVDEPL